jgi:hypothetical protein
MTSTRQLSNVGGAKGSYGERALGRGGKTRLDENPTTEIWEHIEALKKQASGDGLPEQLFQRRQKLGQKAKPEPKFRFSTLYGRIHWRITLEAAGKRVRAKQGGGFPG